MHWKVHLVPGYYELEVKLIALTSTSWWIEGVHNFVQKSLIEKLGFTIEKLTDFKVYIGSGVFLLCSEVCRNADITCQGINIRTDLFLLAIEGANVVLGVQWLETLGLVLTNYRTLTTEFLQVDSRIQGDPFLIRKALTKGSLKKWLQVNKSLTINPGFKSLTSNLNPTYSKCQGPLELIHSNVCDTDVQSCKRS